MSDHKGRFGTFALLPLPHVDTTLKEIEYVLRHFETGWRGHVHELRR